jgi:hypothetical protein
MTMTVSCGIQWQQQEATRRRRQGKGNKQGCGHNNQLEVMGAATDDSNDWWGGNGCINISI